MMLAPINQGSSPEPFFSVITVCFRDLPNLIRTAESIREQSFSNYEWIVIDGAGLDGTDEWLSLQSDTRLKWLSEPDAGIYDAMNKGIAQAAGKYLIFMNSGDCFEDSSVLDLTYKAAYQVEKLPFGLLYGDSIRFSPEAGESIFAAKSPSGVWWHMFAQHQAIFFLRDGSLYDVKYRLSADYDLISRYVGKYKERMLRLDFVVCRYALGGRSESGRWAAIREDFDIRVNSMKINPFCAFVLLFLHTIHSVWKFQIKNWIRTNMRYGKTLPRSV